MIYIWLHCFIWVIVKLNITIIMRLLSHFLKLLRLIVMINVYMNKEEKLI